ncbi:hypothetical protein Dda_9235 [Drechslerella dactyloides]|uniref:BTB domain-containing protein n=1 Tax=Drechslerella dactyloides TaxID=74499 RepID=A0AAD6IPH3_DREDA|nr:hypothetical protein Dda_9235 [Drechslerella dactyloides]
MLTIDIVAPYYCPEFSDCTLVVGQASAVFHGHRNFLALHSPFFRAAFTSTVFREAKERRIRLPEISSDAIAPILTWMYQGPCTLPKTQDGVINYKLIHETIEASDFLQTGDFKNTLYSSIRTTVQNLDSTKEENDAVLMELLDLYHGATESIGFAALLAYARSCNQRLASHIMHLDNPRADFLKNLCGLLLRELDKHESKRSTR